MRVIHRQQGMTLISLVFLMCGIGFVAMLVLKVGPIYLEHSKVTASLAAVEESVDVLNKSDSEIREMVRKRFDLNYVTNVTARDLVITKSGGYLKVQLQYEVVENIMGNLSVLVEFDDVIEVGQP